CPQSARTGPHGAPAKGAELEPEERRSYPRGDPRAAYPSSPRRRRSASRRARLLAPQAFSAAWPLPHTQSWTDTSCSSRASFASDSSPQRLQVDRDGVHQGLLARTVANAMALNCSSGFELRSTFMRSMAPCHPARRKSARSRAGKLSAISPAACASAMHAAKGSRHSAKILERRVLNGLLSVETSRLRFPMRHPSAHFSALSFPVMTSK